MDVFILVSRRSPDCQVWNVSAEHSRPGAAQRTEKSGRDGKHKSVSSTGRGANIQGRGLFSDLRKAGPWAEIQAALARLDAAPPPGENAQRGEEGFRASQGTPT